MDLDRHDFQLEELMTRIKDGDHRLIALQVPEGLKMQALEMMDAIETDTSAKVVLRRSVLRCLRSGARQDADDGRGTGRAHGPLSDEHRFWHAHAIHRRDLRGRS